MIYNDVLYYLYEANGDEWVFYRNGTSEHYTKNEFNHKIYTWSDSDCSYVKDMV